MFDFEQGSYCVVDLILSMVIENVVVGSIRSKEREIFFIIRLFD